MTKCAFCGKEERTFKGTHLIRNTGIVSFFCSGKCRKNSEKLRRDKRKLKWTEAFHIGREKVQEKARIAQEKISEQKKEAAPEKKIRKKK